MSVSTPTRKPLVDSDEIASSRPEILIVDADPASRSSLCELVSPIARAVDVGTSEDALFVASTRELAAILIDLDLPPPGDDGFQLLARLRDRGQGRNVPALLLSHEPDPLLQRRGDEIGALGYVR